MSIDIERYIAKEMSEEEAKEFKNLLASDKKLAEEYSSTLAAHQLIKEAGRLELKDTLESFDQEMESSSKTVKVIPLWVKRALPIAAMLVVFFGIYQFMNLNNTITGNEVYNTYFEMYSSPSLVRDSENSILVNWENAANYYREGDFENAITFFEKTDNEVPIYLSSFYIGISSMAQETPNYKIALENFETVLNIDNDYKQQASWYKGLALLELNRKEEALLIFKSISKSKEYNYLMAEEIINLEIEN